MRVEKCCLDCKYARVEWATEAAGRKIRNARACLWETTGVLPKQLQRELYIYRLESYYLRNKNPVPEHSVSMESPFIDCACWEKREEDV